MSKLYIQFSDDGQGIRKWSREPFEGGVAYVAEDEAEFVSIPRLEE